MDDPRGDEHERLVEALELVDKARRIVDGYAPTAGAHLGSATVVLRALISSAPDSNARDVRKPPNREGS